MLSPFPVDTRVDHLEPYISEILGVCSRCRDAMGSSWREGCGVLQTPPDMIFPALFLRISLGRSLANSLVGGLVAFTVASKLTGVIGGLDPWLLCMSRIELMFIPR